MTAQSLWISKTGLDAQQTRMSLISHNLANVNTTGFKKERGDFEDLLYQNVRQVGAQSTQNTTLPSGLQVGLGVRIAATERIHTQGNLQQTGNVLDVAIQGKGFLQILMPDGTINYTRDGTLKMDSEGQIVTANGNPLEPAVTVPPTATSVTIGTDGTVSALVSGGTTETLGQITLASFVNPTGLESVGDNLYRQSVASGDPVVSTPGTDSLGTLQQGFLETSNVNVVEELVNMIETQRAYEMNSKAVETTDQMLAFLTNNL
jgi:flagellar basal-body rod protein FlgG